jgi:hypothetical protein
MLDFQTYIKLHAGRLTLPYHVLRSFTGYLPGSPRQLSGPLLYFFPLILGMRGAMSLCLRHPAR